MKQLADLASIDMMMRTYISPIVGRGIEKKTKKKARIVPIINLIQVCCQVCCSMGKTLYSVLEQHIDGSWWYHPGLTYATKEEAEQGFLEHFWWDKGRPHRIFEHTEPLYQKYSTCTWDFKTFGFQGLINWPKEKEE